MQELEAFFRGAGWNVIKVVWGREWDDLLAKDEDGSLVKIMNETVDGDYQTYKAESGAFVREHFFGKTPQTKEMVQDLTDDQIWNLKRGGHDYNKVYAAYKAATEFKGKPTVILAHTVKGYGLGTHFEGRNATHQMKKLTLADLKAFRDHLRIPITDEQLEADLYRPPYYHPGMDSPEIQYLMDRRKELGGFVPERRSKHADVTLPDEKVYEVANRGSGKQHAATTMAFVRLLKDLMRDKEFGKRIVPIIPDEARTFGMDAFFPTAKIYNPNGQNYLSVDRELVLAYKESISGQIVHAGINEAGSVAAFTAAGNVLRHPRRTAHPGLRLLLDVRVPAHRRLLLGRRRPDDPRVHHRRHRRPHHPDRRRPAARRRALPHAGRHQPGRRHLRPGIRLRDRRHHARRPQPDVRSRHRPTTTRRGT